MSQLAGVKVGDTLYVLGERGRVNRSVYERTVTAVGRRWVSAHYDERFDMNTGLEDAGNYTPHRLAFKSRDDLDRYAARLKAEDEARKLMNLPRLDHLSNDQLAQLIDILRPTTGAAR